jgi:hypothetical protein
MPVEQGGRLDDESGPDRAPQQPTCRRQEHPVRRRESRTTGLAAQDRQFVTEHDDLQILELVGTKQETNQLQNALQPNVTDGQEHHASTNDESAGYFMQIEFAHRTPFLTFGSNTELLICEVKSSVDGLSFNRRLRTDDAGVNAVLRWSGLVAPDHVPNTVQQLLPLLQDDAPKDAVRAGVTVDGLRIRALLCCPCCSIPHQNGASKVTALD